MNQPIPGTTLASVLQLRLADFNSKAVVEQARLRAQLEAVVAASLSLVPERDRLVLEASDGLAIAVLGNPAGAFAVAQRCLEAAQVLPVCIGMHHGAIALAGDGDDAGLVGDGLRSAGVAAGFAKPSQILVTRAFREALSTRAPAHQAGLPRAGAFADDSVRTHEMFVADRGARARRRRLLLGTGVACVVLGIAAGVGSRLYQSGVLKLPSSQPAQAVATAPAPQAAPVKAPAAVAPQAQPKPAPAVLVFRVTPAGRVLIDGKHRGDIPKLQRLELPPGRYQLEIRYRLEQPLRRTLDLRSGQQVVVAHRFFEPPKVFDKLFK